MWCGRALPGRALALPRDGRSRWTCPLFSFCPRGPSPVFPPCPLGRVRKAGVGVWPPALTFGLPSPALGCLVRPLVFGHKQTRLLRLPGVCPERPSPRWEGCAAAMPRGPAWVCEVPRWTPGGAPGELQVVPQAPEAGRRCCFPLTLCPPRSRHGGERVSHEWLSLRGGRGGESSTVCSPRRGR